MTNLNKQICNTYNVNMQKHLRIKLTLFLVLFIIVISGCAKEPIKIAFIGDLSSKNSQLAIDARNALDLAVQLANDKEGINGRPIQLVVKDDEGLVDTAGEKHKELIEENIKFVIGHLNSHMAPAIIEYASKDLMFVSPSMSTTVLSMKDDFFLRSGPVSNNQATLFAEYVIEEDLEDVVIVYDLMNEQYTRTVAEGIQEILLINNKTIKEMIAYNTQSDDLYEVAGTIIDAEPKNLMIIAQASDSAYLFQKVKKEFSEVNSYSVSWSMTKDFISNGGKIVEGTKFVGLNIPDDFSDEYKEFADAFKEYYDYELSFIGVLAYDSLNMYIKAMEQADKLEPEQVKEAIINIGSYEGLYVDYEVDIYGDNNKKYLMYELTDGEFIPIRDWTD